MIIIPADRRPDVLIARPDGRILGRLIWSGSLTCCEGQRVGRYVFAARSSCDCFSEDDLMRIVVAMLEQGQETSGEGAKR